MTDTGGQNVQDIIQRHREDAYSIGFKAGMVAAGTGVTVALLVGTGLWQLSKWVVGLP